MMQQQIQTNLCAVKCLTVMLIQTILLQLSYRLKIRLLMRQYCGKCALLTTLALTTISLHPLFLYLVWELIKLNCLLLWGPFNHSFIPYQSVYLTFIFVP